MKSKKTQKPTENPYVINELQMVSPDRSRKDIGKLKLAIESAESILFPNRADLYDLYHDVFSMDGHLSGIIEKRINSVLNKRLNFIKKDGTKDNNFDDLIASTEFRSIITAIMESKIWGLSGLEFIIGTKLCVKEIPRKHIKPEKKLITKHQYSINESDGFLYEEMPFVWVIGRDNDLGLLLRCSLYAIYKRGNFGDWAQYVELFGQPVRIVYYDAYDSQTKTELRKMLNESGSSLAMMIPKQAEFEMLDGKTSNGDGQLQARFREVCNEEMSIAILGNSETTVSSKSSGYAQSKEHASQQNELIMSDLTFVANLLNSDKFCSILQSYGYEINGRFVYETEINLEKLKARIDIDIKISEVVPIEDDYWYNTYGIPKPKNYKQLKTEKTAEKQHETEDNNEANTNARNSKKEGKTDDKSTPKSLNELTDFTHNSAFTALRKQIADFFDQALH